jgi:hypothetical protein
MVSVLNGNETINVRYGTPGAPSPELIERLVKSLRGAIQTKQDQIKKALIARFKDNIREGKFGTLLDLVTSIRAGSHADLVGPDGEVKRWLGALFRAVMNFFLDESAGLSMRKYFLSGNIPKALVCLAYASLSLFCSYLDYFCTYRFTDLLFDSLCSELRSGSAAPAGRRSASF